jgi:hypothetical protein
VAGSSSRRNRSRSCGPASESRASSRPAGNSARTKSDLRRFGSSLLRLLHLVWALAALQLACAGLASGAVDLLADKNGDFRGPVCASPPASHPDPFGWTGAAWYNDDGDYVTVCAWSRLGEQLSSHGVSVVADTTGPVGFEQLPAARIVWDASGNNGMTMTGTNDITGVAGDVFYVAFFIKCPAGAGLHGDIYSGQGTVIPFYDGTGACTGSWQYIVGGANSVVTRNYVHVKFRELSNSQTTNVDGQIYLIKYVRLFKNPPGGIVPPPEFVVPLGQTIGCGGGLHAINPSFCTNEPVNTLTGTYTNHVTDARLSTLLGVPFSFERSYATNDSDSGRLGSAVAGQLLLFLEYQRERCNGARRGWTARALHQAARRQLQR